MERDSAVTVLENDRLRLPEPDDKKVVFPVLVLGKQSLSPDPKSRPSSPSPSTGSPTSGTSSYSYRLSRPREEIDD